MTQTVPSVPSEIQAVTRHFFGLAERVLTQIGQFDPSLYTVTVSGERITSMTNHPLPPDFRSHIAKKLPGLIAKNPIVVVVVEAWASQSSPKASADPDRKEIIGISIYANDKYYWASFPIYRNPTRIEYQDPVESQMPIGTLAPGGATAPLSPAESQKMAGLMRRLVEKGPEGWETNYAMMLINYKHRTRNIEPVTHALYDFRLPAKRAEDAIRILDRVMTIVPVSPAQGQQAGNMWLTAIHLRTGKAYASAPMSVDEITQTFAQSVRDIMPPYVAFYPAPRGEVFSYQSYLPISILQGLAVHAVKWADSDSIIDEFLTEYIEDKNIELLDKLSPIAGSLPSSFILFAACFDSSPVNLEPWDTRLSWDIQTDIVSGILTKAAEITSEKCQVELFYDGFEPAYEGMHTLASKHNQHAISFVVSEEQRHLNPPELVAEITMAAIQQPIDHESLYVVIWSKEGKLIAPVSFQRQPHQFRDQWIDEVTEQCRSAGIQEVKVYPGILPRSENVRELIDVFIPDFHGGWSNASDMAMPEAKGMLQQCLWEYVDEVAFTSATVASLPYPHRLARAGLGEVIQRHYTLPVYKLIKETCSDLTIPTSQLWDRVCEKEPRFRPFMEKMPNWSRPDELATFSTRVIWGKAPTLITTPSLSERLALTDIDLRLPAQFVRIPYGIAYLHFESSPSAADVRIADDGGKEDVMRLEGAFLESYAAGAGARHFQIVPIWSSRNSRGRSIYTVIDLAISDDLTPVGDLLYEFYKVNDVEAGIIEDNQSSIEEILKVLVYLNVKDARITDRPDRTMMLKGIGQKKATHQIKLLETAAGRCDHILVGPEAPLNIIQATGLSGRTMPVHMRRGHIHAYRVGKDRKEVIVKFLDPVIVNKHLLGDGDAPPIPKNYRLI